MTKIRVIDFETTGLPEDDVKAICEAGWTDIFDDGSISETRSVLVNPGHPIPPVTQAIHHISDAEVADAITPTQACQQLMSGMEEGDMFAAHNAAFEKEFFGGAGLPWICTMKCAQHLFPDAPRHSNQVLRYWLRIDDQEDFHADKAMPPHRAGPDTYVTAYILSHLTLMQSPADLVHLTTQPVLLVNVTFGKHRGQKGSDLPASYLEWIAYKSDFGADQKHTARHYLGVNQ